MRVKDAGEGEGEDNSDGDGGGRVLTVFLSIFLTSIAARCRADTWGCIH